MFPAPSRILKDLSILPQQFRPRDGGIGRTIFVGIFFGNLAERRGVNDVIKTVGIAGSGRYGAGDCLGEKVVHTPFYFQTPLAPASFSRPSPPSIDAWNQLLPPFSKHSDSVNNSNVTLGEFSKSAADYLLTSPLQSFTSFPLARTYRFQTLSHLPRFFFFVPAVCFPERDSNLASTFVLLRLYPPAVIKDVIGPFGRRMEDLQRRGSVKFAYFNFGTCKNATVPEDRRVIVV
ncbi:hypothetical protein Trydic_g23496 [Trypoxylus dichotomus]